jgi:hypothetical protein
VDLEIDDINDKDLERQYNEEEYSTINTERGLFKAENK